jgi:catechol 2,3-dioxygenase-like lactoylglutathione lyase family enzyme
VDWKLELVPIPVSDVDRAKSFYTEKVGFKADHDHRFGEKFRVVQLTPPGSACSIAFGQGVVETPPGSVQGLHLVVPDIHAARAELAGRGVAIGEVKAYGGGISFAFFKDPDGNGWALQEIAPGARRPEDPEEVQALVERIEAARRQ